MQPGVPVSLHPQMDLKALVHGDDFVFSGRPEDTKWVQEELANKFEIKTKTIGQQAGNLMEARVLNRVIRITPEGWEYEADQRHSDLIIEGLGLTSAKSVLTPGEKGKQNSQRTRN